MKLRAGKSYLEQALQHLYLWEMSCDITPSTEEPTINENAEEFRPRRNASKITQIRMIDLTNDGMEELLNEYYLIMDDSIRGEGCEYLTIGVENWFLIHKIANTRRIGVENWFEQASMCIPEK